MRGWGFGRNRGGEDETTAKGKRLGPGPSGRPGRSTSPSSGRRGRGGGTGTEKPARRLGRLSCLPARMISDRSAHDQVSPDPQFSAPKWPPRGDNLPARLRVVDNPVNRLGMNRPNRCHYAVCGRLGCYRWRQGRGWLQDIATVKHKTEWGKTCGKLRRRLESRRLGGPLFRKRLTADFAPESAISEFQRTDIARLEETADDPMRKLRRFFRGAECGGVNGRTGGLGRDPASAVRGCPE